MATPNELIENVAVLLILAAQQWEALKVSILRLSIRQGLLTLHQRFYHDNAEGYNANDRELLHGYMADKGYKRPMDIWLDNLKTIMELRMDPEGKWVEDLTKRMFTDDAMWFITHAQFMYMAICTPSDPNDEFILTDNSYNVFEGPNYFAVDKDSGKVEATAYSPLHEFAPISLKLMIVLRSFMYPVLEEDNIGGRSWI